MAKYWQKTACAPSPPRALVSSSAGVVIPEKRRVARKRSEVSFIERVSVTAGLAARSPDFNRKARAGESESTGALRKSRSRFPQPRTSPDNPHYPDADKSPLAARSAARS